jgi:hypothetical protein
MAWQWARAREARAAWPVHRRLGRLGGELGLHPLRFLQPEADVGSGPAARESHQVQHRAWARHWRPLHAYHASVVRIC